MNQSKQKKFLDLAEYYFRSNAYQLAEDILKIVINTEPNSSKANELLAYIYGNQGNLDSSYKLLELSCRSNECSPDALYHLGSAQLERNLFEEASLTLQRSLQKAGDFFEALHDLGTAYGHLGKTQEALLCYTDCIKLNPNSHELHFNIARCLDDLKRYDEAHTHYDKAIQLNPDFFDSHWNKSLTCLVLGDFDNGWNWFDYRWKKKDADQYRHYQFPELESLGNIADKNILVSHEQGLGDTIQFSRYVLKLIELGANVTFKVQEPLLNLLSTQLECVTTSEIQSNSKFDYQVPLLTLPKLFKTNLENIPPSIHIKINGDEISRWANQLNLSTNQLNIGIAVSGNPIHINDLNRSIPLMHLSPLFHFGKFFIIQKHINESDQKVLSHHKEVIFLGEKINDFVDTAAIIINMDLIISVDTSLIHLAGSLDKESMLMLPWCPEWRWLIDKSDSPWYPSLKILRQESQGSWDSVVTQIKIALEKKLSH